MGTVIDFKTIVNQAVNYNRYYLQELIKYNKPIVVVAKFAGQSNSAYTKYTFTNIKPYVPDDYVSYDLTQHINIQKSYFEEFYPETENLINKDFVIVCKPYYYYDDNKIKRASLEPTNELLYNNFPAFCLLSESFPADMIPYDKVIDFRTEFNYKFACPRNSKYQRYENGVPIKNFVYIQSLSLNNNLESINSEKANSLDTMIEEVIGINPYDKNSKKHKPNSFYKNTNIKSVLRSTAKRKMNDLRHRYVDSIRETYNLFEMN